MGDQRRPGHISVAKMPRLARSQECHDPFTGHVKGNRSCCVCPGRGRTAQEPRQIQAVSLMRRWRRTGARGGRRIRGVPRDPGLHGRTRLGGSIPSETTTTPDAVPQRAATTVSSDRGYGQMPFRPPSQRLRPDLRIYCRRRWPNGTADPAFVGPCRRASDPGRTTGDARPDRPESVHGQRPPARRPERTPQRRPRSSTETSLIPLRCGRPMPSTCTPPTPRPPSTPLGPTSRPSPCPVTRGSRATTWGTPFPPFPTGRSPASSGRRRCGPDPMAPTSCTTPRRRPSHSAAWPSLTSAGCVHRPTGGRAPCASRGRPVPARQARSSTTSSSAFVCPVVQGGCDRPQRVRRI